MSSAESQLGAIHLILGPMFSGKSTELLRRVRRFTIAKRKVLVVKYAKDTRYSEDSMATHDKVLWDAVSCSRLDELSQKEVLAHDVIGIDEGQFFPGIVDWASNMATKHHKVIVIAALDGTFQRLPFGTILNLVPCAETVTKLHAVCMRCSADAPFSARISTETEVEVIGGADKYLAVCRKCFDSLEQEHKSTRKITSFLKQADDPSAVPAGAAVAVEVV